MKNFGRVLAIAARRRAAIVGILLTSLVVALLWGANISVLYPLVEVVFDKEHESLADYNDFRIAEAKTQLIAKDQQIEALNQKLSAVNLSSERSIDLLQRVESETYERTLIANSITSLEKVKPWIDAYAPNGAYATLLFLMGLLVFGTFIKLVALGGNLMLVQYVSERTSLDLRNEFFRKTLHLDLEAFGENGSADLTARLTNDISNVSTGINALLGRLIREPLKMLVCLSIAAYICPRLLLLVMVITPLAGLVMHHMSRAIRRASRRAMEEMSQMYGLLNNSFAGIRVVKAFNTQGAERAKFKHGTTKFYHKSMKMAFYNTLARSSSEMLGICTVTMAILAGGYLAVHQGTHLLGIRMTDQPLGVGQVMTFFAALIGASDPAKKLSEVWAGLQRGLAATERVYAIIDRQTRVSEPVNPQSVARPHHKISFDDIVFQYPSGPTVLQGVDLTVRHGETIAIVGPNGGGKSTLISLLCRFDDPTSGQVLLDDVPVDQMRTRDLRRRIALVTQRTVLFDDTIENNIRYGSPGADSHAVVRAAKMAFADDFIRQKTPEGYKTMLGGGGMRLSGGQMQRIALARAFLRDPDILILDEATSQIDLESEQLIHQALAKFLVDRTGIMITHRPTSLAMADRIVVIESGKVAAEGSHNHLIKSNRFYQSLCGTEMSRAA
ncbi:ABC transporter ATP-binding protein/permease [Rubripirellula amarantea]|nr:ABC transporter ATP-binding protein/permease [Rubripirellula amarantea]